MNKLIPIILIFTLTFFLASCTKTMTVSNPTQEPLQTEMSDTTSADSKSSQTNGQDQQGQANATNSNNNSNTFAGKTTPGNGAGISTPIKNSGSTNNGITTNNAATTAPIISTPKPSENVTITEVPKNTVTISITGPSSRGVIIARTRIDFIDGDTVFTALKSITKQKNIRIDSTSTLPGTEYIKGIDNIYQFDEGGGSGWLFAVNGISSGIGCGSYKLKDGDDIEWRYSIDLGKDIGWNL